MSLKKSFLFVLSALCMLFSLQSLTSASTFGDSNLDGNVDIVDVQCSIIVALKQGESPECKFSKDGLEPEYCKVECLKSDVGKIDYQCNGKINVVDTQAITLLANGQGDNLQDKTPGCPTTNVCTNKEWIKEDAPTVSDLGSYYSMMEVWGINKDHVFAVGSESNPALFGTESKATIFEYKNGKWLKAILPEIKGFLTSIWGDPLTSEVFAAGNNGTILHYKDGVWEKEDSKTDKTISDIYVFDSKNVYAMAQDTLLHFDGTEWSIQKKWLFPENMPFKFFGTKDGTLIGINGGLHSVMEVEEGNLEMIADSSGLVGYPTAIWGESKDNMVMLQTNPNLSYELKNKILHYDGEKWSVANIATDSGIPDEVLIGKQNMFFFNSVDGQSPSNVYALGHIVDYESEFSEHILIMNYDGAQWRKSYFDKSPVAPASFSNLWVAENGDVFAVGFGGSTLHYTCKEEARNTTRSLR